MGFIANVPCIGGVATAAVRVEPTSLLSTEGALRVVSAGVVALLLNAVGVTVTATVAVAVCPLRSVTV